MTRKVFLILWVGLVLTGCMTASQHQQTLPSAEERKLTTGVVQKEIRKGMSQADVAAALGSPNLVTKDKKGIETWIYDKISTEYAYSTSSGGVAIAIGKAAFNPVLLDLPKQPPVFSCAIAFRLPQPGKKNHCVRSPVRDTWQQLNTS